ncbi:MAG TPA: hypothetical protein DD649_05995 [Providencia sp.]|nr:type II toxin-antitoxin system RelE/ParE family toxin [Providencia sp.]HBO22426.1 hypothetical protein [Providencia sp.]
MHNCTVLLCVFYFNAIVSRKLYQHGLFIREACVNGKGDCRLYFRDEYLRLFYVYGKLNKLIPTTMNSVLARKLDMLNAATTLRDFKSPPGNRFKQLKPPLDSYYSIRVNGQYRLIFKWDDAVTALYLDPHKDV